MPHKLLVSIKTAFIRNLTPAKKISCYHCGEKSSPSRTIYVQFNGEIRAVCCNGCAAILKTVADLDMLDSYLANKIQLQNHNE